jgi:hypothetical protein
MTNRVRDDVNSTATTASKERQPGSVQIPDLDATQELVIAVLKTTREHWHSSVDPYVEGPCFRPDPLCRGQSSAE